MIIWKFLLVIFVEVLQIVLCYIYLGDVLKEFVFQGSCILEEEVVKGLDKISKDLEVEYFWEVIMVGGDRRFVRQ